MGHTVSLAFILAQRGDAEAGGPKGWCEESLPSRAFFLSWYLQQEEEMWVRGSQVLGDRSIYARCFTVYARWAKKFVKGLNGKYVIFYKLFINKGTKKALIKHTLRSLYYIQKHVPNWAKMLLWVYVTSSWSFHLHHMGSTGFPLRSLYSNFVSFTLLLQ